MKSGAVKLVEAIDKKVFKISGTGNQGSYTITTPN